MDKLVAADARLQQFTRSTYVALSRNERYGMTAVGAKRSLLTEHVSSLPNSLLVNLRSDVRT
jgi:hypothetical protein